MDSSALYAGIRGETGSATVHSLLPDSIISAVNYAEIVAILNRHPQVEFIESILRKFPIKVIEFTKKNGKICGMLEKETKKKGLSLGDRACLALAIHKKATVITADRIWQELELPIPIQLIR